MKVRALKHVSQATKGAELTEELVKMKKAEEESKVKFLFDF